MTVGELFVTFGLKPEGWDKGNKLLSGLAGAAKRYIGVQAIKSIMGFVEHTTEAATHLVSLSAAMGMTVEQTQQWGYVAEQSGSNLKELSTGLNMFLRNVREVQAGRGGKSLKAMFGQLGIDAETQKKIFSGSMGFNDTLLVMSDRIKAIGVKSATVEATLTKMFGVRAGRAMLADLARGSDGIKALFARRAEMGLLDAKQAANLRDLGNRIKDVKLSFSALGAQVLGTLAPALIKMAEAATKWIEANRDIIGGALAAALSVLASLFSAIGTVVSYLGDLIHRMLGGEDGATAIVIGLASALMTVLVPALWAIAAPVVAVLWPFFAIAAAAAGLAFIIIKIREHLDGIVDALLAAGAVIIDAILNPFGFLQKLITYVGSFIITTLIGAFKRVVAAIRDNFDGAIKWIVDKWHAFTDWLESLPDRALAAARALKDAFFDALSAIADKIEDMPVIGTVFKGYRALTNLPDAFGAKDDAHKTGTMTTGAGVRGGDYIKTPPPTANMSPGRNGGTTNSSHSNSTTNNIEIKVDGAKDPNATATAIGEHLDNHMRQTQRGLGGDVQ